MFPALVLPRARYGLAALAALALVVGLLSRPSSAIAASAEQAFQPYWVQNHTETELWSGPDGKATRFGRALQFSYFKVLQRQQSPRLYVFNPLSEGTAWIAAAAVGPSGEPPDWYFAKKGSSDSIGRINLPGRIVGGANVRSRPAVGDDDWLGRLGHNSPIQVLDEVTGEDGESWYRIADGQFVHHSLVRVPKPFPPHTGKVMVAELTQPVVVTAYEDGKAVYSAMAVKGTISWGTPTGFFTIVRRVANETMDSATLGIPRDGPGGYHLKDVLYTQYFTADGASIHYNYWSANFGYTGSHGCLGMSLDDSLWFWEWASLGTPLFIQE